MCENGEACATSGNFYRLRLSTAAVRFIPNRFLCLGVPGSERPLGVAEPEAPARPAEPIGVIPRDWWATRPPPGVATREPGVTIAWRAPEPGREPPRRARR